LPTFLDKQECK